ncbi:MAG: hypothetical protein U0667_19235 [Chloroflexota bacterium]
MADETDPASGDPVTEGDATTPSSAGPVADATPATPAPAAQPAATSVAAGASGATGAGAEEEVLRGAYTAVADNAPWKRGARWEVVVAQGVVLGIVGLVVWLAPGFGAAAVLQLIALLVLAMALLSVWRLVRGRVAPGRLSIVAFRAGVGVTIGLVTLIGAFIVEDRSVGTVALAIVLGIGLVLYGLIAAVGAIAHREGGVPVVALLVSAVTVIVGVMLVLNGRNGIDSLQGTFVALGIVMLLVGLALVGYGLMMRNAQVSPGPTDD